MNKRIPKSVSEAPYIPLWRRGRRFTATGLRLVQKKSGKHSHFTGGPAPHKGAGCPECRRQLTLLWNLDLADPLFPDFVRNGFAPISRLPFYICWQCLSASYCVSSDDRIKCFSFDRYSDPLEPDESPFQDSPDELPRRKVFFERLPSTIDALLSLEDIVGLEMLDPPARAAINTFYKDTITSTWRLPFSQFGGQPLIVQSHQNVACPNLKCPASQLKHPYGELQVPYLMKEMAVIHHDHEPELEKHCFQLLYYVCGICFSVRAEYRCS